MKNLILFIKGCFIGIANIIPGVSGGTIALILGVYERLIDIVSNFFKNIKENIKYLLPIALGMGISILVSSNLIDSAYNSFPLATTLFFVGLVIGGVPFVYKKLTDKKDILNISIGILTFALVVSLTLLGSIASTDELTTFSNFNLILYIKLFFVGIIASATMVIPGISGSLVLMLLGYYYPIINLIKSFLHFENFLTSLASLFIFGIGVLVGIVLISKLINKLLKNHANKTYFGVLGFVIASIFAIPFKTFTTINYSFNIIELIVGIILLVIGYILARKLGEK